MMCREALAFQSVFLYTLDLNGMGPSSSSGLSFVSAIWTRRHYISLKKPGAADQHAATNGQQLPKLLSEKLILEDFGSATTQTLKLTILRVTVQVTGHIASRKLLTEHCGMNPRTITPLMCTHIFIFTSLCLRWMYICSWAVQYADLYCAYLEQLLSANCLDPIKKCVQVTVNSRVVSVD